MNYFLKGISYSYKRNIGWQDRTVRTVLGVCAVAGSIYMLSQDMLVSALLGVFALAQFGTVLSARCIVCYFAGQCTIDAKERMKLNNRGIDYEKRKN